MSRTIIFIIAGIIIAAGAIVGGIMLWRAVVTPPPAPQPIVPGIPAPVVDPALRVVSMGNVLSPSRDATGRRIRYFDSQEFNLKDADFATAASSLLSEIELRDIIRVFWSPGPDLAIIEREGQFVNRSMALVNLTTGSLTELPPNIRTLAWSPDSRQIAFHLRNDLTGENAIYIASPDAANRRLVMPLGLFAVNLFWLDANRLLIAEKPAPGVAPLVIARNLRNNTTQLVFNNKFGAAVLPSPDGTKLLVSSTPDALGTRLITEILSINGEILQGLPFSTLAEKCAWGADSETIYCAVPEVLVFENLPFSYWAGRAPTNDAFIAHQYTTGETREITPAALNVDAIDLVISGTEDAFAFVNRLDGRLTIFKP